METRKVQVTGGSTYTVSLPKGWATAHGVEAGGEIEFYPEEGSLLLTPRTETENAEGTLDVTGLNDGELTRAVVTMYVSGFDVITLETASVDAAQRRTIRETAQGLVGLEIIEETAEHVSLQDLLDSAELSIHNAVTRMRLVALTMLDDAVTALRTGDEDLAADVIERDDDVDRLWYMTSRVFRGALRHPSAASDIGLPRETCFDYHTSARQLERVADHATKIADLAGALDGVPDDAGEALGTLHSDAAAVVETAMDALLSEDSDEAVELANEAMAGIETVDERAREVDDLLRTLDPQRVKRLGLVADSLSRSADYGGNIAETALQKAAPRP
ncbi:phosphate uptake regulator PhoU [Halococcus thailandensis]|uniref:Phosphate uptake regulator PhoU n=1 Tax=Halococcus thailandensis JCM 13552 TaxID=1227457 RepID=M0N5A0_9EURY|nr:phosphate uptake regulator PhoU [Halococcus thailandensis]EMA51875.1 phosphate uptake regulator PhoU [Halococcus thailandensis JCM 13552]